MLRKYIDINGEKYCFECNFTISSLLDYLRFNKALIVLDYNGSILQKEFWSRIKIKNNDRIEILTIAGGG